MPSYKLGTAIAVVVCAVAALFFSNEDHDLFVAALHGDKPFLQERLARAGAGLTAVDYFGNSILHWAGKGGHLSTIMFLLVWLRTSCGGLHSAVCFRKPGQTCTP